jgi:hypothetical protein
MPSLYSSSIVTHPVQIRPKRAKAGVQEVAPETKHYIEKRKREFVRSAQKSMTGLEVKECDAPAVNARPRNVPANTKTTRPLASGLPHDDRDLEVAPQQ